MIEIWTVIVLIVGIILAFVGAFMARESTSLRKPVDVMHTRIDQHDLRINALERLSAKRDAQIEAVILGIAELKRLLEKHVEKGC